MRVSGCLCGGEAITSSSALQAYELALMSAEDMRFVRGRNNSISALLYILNRLAAVAYAVSTGNEVLPAVTTLDVCIPHAIILCGRIYNLFCRREAVRHTCSLCLIPEPCSCTTINYAIGIAYALSLAVTACESFITRPLAQHIIHSEQWYL